MSPPIETPLGHPLPPSAYHAITSHFPTWNDGVDFMKMEPRILGALKSMYPRMIFHKDLKTLFGLIGQRFGVEGKAQMCFLFPAAPVAAACKAFLVSPARGEMVIMKPDIIVKAVSLGTSGINVFPVLFPLDKIKVAMQFWTHVGAGISSRLAEAGLKGMDGTAATLHEIPADSPPGNQVGDGKGHEEIRNRIVSLLERSPVAPARKTKVSPSDVYLFQTGMAGIYYLHQYLARWRTGTTVLFGFAFQSTPHLFEIFSTSYKFYGLGTAAELDALEAWVETETNEKRPVQAVWCEFPTNPLLLTPDLKRLRSLADKYGFALIVDDTIASFANVDLFSAADVVVTSLTKSFSGYADVMGSSFVLNPSSTLYPELKAVCDTHYRNDLFIGDAEVLADNSRNFLPRSAILNRNAAALTTMLQKLAARPTSCVKAVHYPNTVWSAPLYKPYMRPATKEFTPGYGCLFSIEFDTEASAEAFFNAVNVHKGPHLGAHLTLVIPYVRWLYGPERAPEGYAQGYGMNFAMIRVSVGLEEEEDLVETFESAVEVADELNKTAA